jgi:hypothetical protein
MIPTFDPMRRSLTALLLFATLSLFAGGEHLPLGARFAGMGNTGLTLIDVWSMRLNPAGIAGLERPTAGLFYQQHFLSEELASQALAFTLPLGKGTFGITADRFGYSLYRETRTSVAYAMRFNEGLRAAVQMSHIGVRLGENYGSTSAFMAELGVQAKITEALWVGAHIYNPTQARLGTSTEGGVPIDERVPTLLRAGFTYTFSAKLLMNLEVEKDMDRPERYRFGMEYNPNKVLYLRTGISSAPASSHFGVGFRIDRMDIDLAVALRSRLGPTPMLNLNYRFP